MSLKFILHLKYNFPTLFDNIRQQMKFRLQKIQTRLKSLVSDWCTGARRFMNEMLLLLLTAVKINMALCLLSLN